MLRPIVCAVSLFAAVAAAEPQSIEASAPPSPQATKRVGGHLGFVMPFVTARADGFSSIANGVTFGITSGLGLTIIGPLKFDAELVTLIDTANKVVNIVIHPGLLVALPWDLTTGVRGAWETRGAWGFTPLINKGFPIGGNAIYVEAAFPVRFAETSGAASFTAALHVGFGF